MKLPRMICIYILWYISLEWFAYTLIWYHCNVDQFGPVGQRSLRSKIVWSTSFGDRKLKVRFRLFFGALEKWPFPGIARDFSKKSYEVIWGQGWEGGTARCGSTLCVVRKLPWMSWLWAERIGRDGSTRWRQLKLIWKDLWIYCFARAHNTSTWFLFAVHGNIEGFHSQTTTLRKAANILYQQEEDSCWTESLASPVKSSPGPHQEMQADRIGGYLKKIQQLQESQEQLDERNKTCQESRSQRI